MHIKPSTKYGTDHNMNKELIKTINRYFHDEEALHFCKRHEKRISSEAILYKNFFKEYFEKNEDTINILDIGSGTGLVEKTVPSGKANFVSSDISATMLHHIRKNEISQGSSRFHYVACDAEKLPFKNDTFDIITCNAAMHHIPSIDLYAKELDRVLKSNGVIIIGFEANRRFWNTKILSFLYRILSKLSIKKIDNAINYAKICQKVNEKLLGEKIIDKSLSDTEILKYVDIHSPNAGEKLDYSKGFDVDNLVKNVFKNYKTTVIYHFESAQFPVRILGRLFFPQSAPQFSLIMEKKVK